MPLMEAKPGNIVFFHPFVPRNAIDSKKIMTQLGWQPQKEFKTSMEETIRWYTDNSSWVETMLSNTKH